jgi:hypothetical protein
MKPDEWWKNFALGLELDTAGTFVYNGLKALHDAATLHHTVDVFEILYNVSVGVERLLKVAIVLVEHDDHSDIEALEASLFSHSSIALADRLCKIRSLDLKPLHREFLSLLSHFYSVHRYERFHLSSVPNVEGEKQLFLGYLCKHLQLTPSSPDDLFEFQNSDTIRKFVGKVVKAICSEGFRIVRERASELNIYTYELRSDSKASKVFQGQRLDFIDEDLKRREMLLFLMHPSSGGKHITLLRGVPPLPFDEGMAPSYVRAIMTDGYMHFVGDEVDEHYTEVANPGERHQFLRIMDDEFLSYGDEEKEFDDSLPASPEAK